MKIIKNYYRSFFREKRKKAYFTCFFASLFSVSYSGAAFSEQHIQFVDAWQSSHAWGNPPADESFNATQAIDNDVNTSSSTYNNLKEWWVGDLGREIDISKLEVWPRSSHRHLLDADILFFDEDPRVFGLQGAEGDDGDTLRRLAEAPRNTVVGNNNIQKHTYSYSDLTARYVMIRHKKEEYGRWLQLGEVKVFSDNPRLLSKSSNAGGFSAVYPDGNSYLQLNVADKILLDDDSYTLTARVKSIVTDSRWKTLFRGYGGHHPLLLNHSGELGVYCNGSHNCGASGFSGSGFNISELDNTKPVTFSAVGEHGSTVFYVNGVQVGNPVPSISKTDIWRIGWPGQRFADFIDHIQIHSSALTRSEIARIHEGGVISRSLEAHWDFEGATTADRLKDKVHNRSLVQVGLALPSATPLIADGDALLIDDSLPAGATPSGQDVTNGKWPWLHDTVITSPFSGQYYHGQALNYSGKRQHFMQGLNYTVKPNDVFSTWVYIGNSRPSGIQVQLKLKDKWWHQRVHWGSVVYGIEGSQSTQIRHNVPSSGQWIELKVDLSDFSNGGVKPGDVIQGIAFSRTGGGQVLWDNTRIGGGQANTDGRILQEVWTGINGTAIDDLTNSVAYPNLPDQTSTVNSFELTHGGNAFGAKLSGLVEAPVTGEYKFWIASDNNGELYMTHGEQTTGTFETTDPAFKRKIAHVPVWTYPRYWDVYPEQESISITLEAGKKYYMEALVKEHGGGDNLAVAWQYPGQSRQVIPGQYLSMPDRHDDDAWNLCAVQKPGVSSHCNIDEKNTRVTVRYGADNKYVYAYNVNSEEGLNCHPSSFGGINPTYGIYKHCQYMVTGNRRQLAAAPNNAEFTSEHKNQTLSKGDVLTNGQLTVAMQDDGNLVFKHGNTVVWQSMTSTAQLNNPIIQASSFHAQCDLSNTEEDACLGGNSLVLDGLGMRITDEHGLVVWKPDLGDIRPSVNGYRLSLELLPGDVPVMQLVENGTNHVIWTTRSGYRPAHKTVQGVYTTVTDDEIAYNDFNSRGSNYSGNTAALGRRLTSDPTVTEIALMRERYVSESSKQASMLHSSPYSNNLGIVAPDILNHADSTNLKALVTSQGQLQLIDHTTVIWQSPGSYPTGEYYLKVDHRGMAIHKGLDDSVVWQVRPNRVNDDGEDNSSYVLVIGASTKRLELINTDHGENEKSLAWISTGTSGGNFNPNAHVPIRNLVKGRLRHMFPNITHLIDDMEEDIRIIAQDFAHGRILQGLQDFEKLSADMAADGFAVALKATDIAERVALFAAPELFPAIAGLDKILHLIDDGAKAIEAIKEGYQKAHAFQRVEQMLSELNVNDLTDALGDSIFDVLEQSLQEEIDKFPDLADPFKHSRYLQEDEPSTHNIESDFDDFGGLCGSFCRFLTKNPSIAMDVAIDGVVNKLVESNRFTNNYNLNSIRKWFNASNRLNHYQVRIIYRFNPRLLYTKRPAERGNSRRVLQRGTVVLKLQDIASRLQLNATTNKLFDGQKNGVPHFISGGLIDTTDFVFAPKGLQVINPVRGSQSDKAYFSEMVSTVGGVVWLNPINTSLPQFMLDLLKGTIRGVGKLFGGSGTTPPALQPWEVVERKPGVDAELLIGVGNTTKHTLTDLSPSNKAVAIVAHYLPEVFTGVVSSYFLTKDLPSASAAPAPQDYASIMTRLTNTSKLDPTVVSNAAAIAASEVGNLVYHFIAGTNGEHERSWTGANMFAYVANINYYSKQPRAGFTTEGETYTWNSAPGTGTEYFSEKYSSRVRLRGQATINFLYFLDGANANQWNWDKFNN